MTLNHSFIPYFPSDRESCLEIFDSNTPGFFAPSERKEFERFLDDLPGPYFVLKVDDQKVIGCGGYAVSRDHEDVAILCWGMIHRVFQRQAWGGRLLEYRLTEIETQPKFCKVSIETSPESSGFFKKFRFQIVEVVEDGFGLGRDLVRMLWAKPDQTQMCCPAQGAHLSSNESGCTM